MVKSTMKEVVYGFVLGDALGVPYEFERRGTFEAKGMTGYGMFNQPKGTWSDDTSLMLCLMENLSEGGNYNDLMDKFSNYRKGYMTPFNNMFDIGIATNAGIDKYVKFGKEPIECGWVSEDSNGNGSLMRVLPLVYSLNEKEFKEVFEEVKNVSSLTHRHPRSILGCLIYVLLMMELMNKVSIETALSTVKQDLESKLDKEYLKELDHYKELFEPKFKENEESKVDSSGYVVSTLLASVWSVMNTNTLSESILKSVNLGKDTDTVGAVTGSLSAMMYGMDEQSLKWLDEVQNRELLDNKLEEFEVYLGGK